MEKINRFVEAIGKPTRAEYRGRDWIPGTDKIRTFTPSPSYLYSRESDLENIVTEKYRPLITRKKEH